MNSQKAPHYSMETKPTFFLYARKSTDEADRQVLSIEAQLTEVREYAAKEGLRIIREFVETKSAKTPGRPIFEQMLAGIEEGKAHGVIAWHPDRLARNAVDAGKIIHLLDLGLLHSLKFPTFWFEKTPQGLFMLNIAFGQSKYYIDNLSENIHRGLRQKLRNGIYPGYAPLGYINELRNHTMLKDPETWEAVNRLFETYATGDYTLQQLQDVALSYGLVSRRSKTKIPISRLQRMLQNPFYYGAFEFKGELFEGKHEPIITKQLYDKVQRVMLNRGKPQKPNHPYQFTFLGMFFCGECGRAITAEQHHKKSGRVFRYYRCTKKGRECHQPFLNETKLVSILNHICDRVSLPEGWLEPIINQLDKEAHQSNQENRILKDQLQQHLLRCDTKLSKLLDLHLDNELSLEDYKSKKNEVLNEKLELKQRITKVTKEGNDWLEPMRTFILETHQAREISKSNNLELKRHFLQKVGSNWELKDKNVRFYAQKEWNLAIRFKEFSVWSG